MTKNWLIFILFITIALLSISGCSPNNPPVFCSIPDQSVNEGDTLELNLLNHATDPDGDTLSFTLITGVGTITENTYIYSPDYNASGTYTVEIEAIDGRGGSASDSFLITVNNANRNPTNPYDLMPTNEMINVSLDTTISWSCSDPDGDPLKYDIYFGISPTPALVASGISNTTYDPGFLEYEQIYYWKVVAVDSHGAKAESSVIHFETKNPSISFARVFGGSDDDRAYCIQQTSDGGYIVAGYTYSNDIDVSGNQGVYDYWVVKLDSSGNIEWQKCFGGSDDDRAYCIQQTSNGGYIVAGYTESNNGDVSGNHGKNDYWIVKLDSSGNIEWQKCLGGYYNDYACSIQQTSNGGYIVAGYTESNNGDVSGNHGSYDYWIVKLDSSGNIRWQKCLGGSGDDRAYSIQQTSDGGYIVTGYTSSHNYDVLGNHGSYDYWIVKLDAAGNIKRQRCLGGSGNDYAYSIQQTSDGGYIVAGYTESNNGDVSGKHGSSDYWIVKLDNFGYIDWQRCLGGSDDDRAYDIQQTSDEGYIVAGYTQSNDGDVSGNHGPGLGDYWIVKLDSSGNIKWQKCLGGYDWDEAHSIQQTNDGYIITGYTESNDGEVSGNHGSKDYWIVRLD